MKHILQIKCPHFLILFFYLITNYVSIDLSFASYPTDPITNTEWLDSSENSVTEIQTRFNNARVSENNQLDISLPMLTLPSQIEWDALTNNEKALWLINREREDRGITPLHGIEENVAAIAQYYADYLLDNNSFSHDADGNTPWERLETNPAIDACHDFLNVAENLAILWGDWTLPLERSIYLWMYDDSSSSWGHRHAILWYPYNDNSGPTGKEGFLGIGHASGTHNGWSNSDIFVMNIFDPCSSWTYTSETGDNDVDLVGVITILQILANNNETSISTTKDINNDGKTGMEEAIFVLQQAASTD